MKILLKSTLASAGLLALAACGGNADDRAAENIEEMTENRVDALETQADQAGNDQVHDMLEHKADEVEDRGEAAADKADDDDDARVEQQFANQM
jgi:hypothetical protein